MTGCWSRVWIGAALLLLPGAGSKAPAAAHPVSVTQAMVYVGREAIDVQLQVFLEDLFLFHDLKPNDRDFLDPDVIQDGARKHEQFLLDRFVLQDISGRRLQGRVAKVDRFAIPDEGVALGELMAHQLTYHLHYDLEAPPEFLTISQRFTDAESILPSEMKLAVKQEGGEAPVKATEMRPHQPETIRFDWKRPPLSAAASAEEREAWTARQQQETLGIASYSSVYSFLYIDDYEVRHEILIPLLTLEQSVLLARDDDEFLDLAEQAAARQQIEAYFRTGNPVEVNGAPVAAVVQRCDFYGLDFKDFARQAEPQKVSLASARVGVILSYSLDDAPTDVKVTWNRFNDFVWAVSMVVFAGEQIEKATLSKLGNRNVYQWRGAPRPRAAAVPAAIPAAVPPAPRWVWPLWSVLCLVAAAAIVAALGRSGWRPAVVRGVAAVVVSAAAAGAAALWPFGVSTRHPWAAPPSLDAAEVRDIVATLQRQAYQSFRMRGENTIYDTLAASVDGALLEEIYLHLRRQVEMQEQGGAVSRIESVALLQCDLVDPGGPTWDRPEFQCRCRWNVAGAVEHWGHIHARTNQYFGQLRIEARDGAWKITSLEVLDEQRVSFTTNLRAIERP